ncbi:MAG: hypothetical protein Q9162_004046 [Coniocarpon cinnabarinum]
MSPIQALQQGTIRALGSSQVITTPDSVVKELVDNALDANCSSIQVEISSNTLDVVQVRDNGHGIAPGDRALICKRYCTSKIKSQEEFRLLGGTTDGEVAATALKFARDGEIVSEGVASQPVGTTVRAVDLFSTLPVRKQAAKKNAAKCLNKVKATLQAYAMARPSVRFSLKVLKSKNDKNNWTYAPKSNPSVEDATLKVVGNNCASRCHVLHVEHDDIEMCAYLPKIDADPSKVSGIGDFFSVDSRPVSANRGLLKQLLEAYKERLRSSRPHSIDIKQPFIWLNIACPPGFYDVNVEPAKNDVIFDDGDKIVQAFHKLLDIAYAVAPSQSAKSSVTPPRPRTSVRQRVSFSVLEDDAEMHSSREQSARRHTPECRSTSPDIDTRNRKEGVVLEDDSVRLPAAADASLPKGMDPFAITRLQANPVVPRINLPRPQRESSQRLQDLSDSEINAKETSHGLPPYPPWTLPTPANSSSPARAPRSSFSDHEDIEGLTMPLSSAESSDSEDIANEKDAAPRGDLLTQQQFNNFLTPHFTPSPHRPPSPTLSMISEQPPSTNPSASLPRPSFHQPNKLLTHVPKEAKRRPAPARKKSEQGPQGTYNDPFGLFTKKPPPSKKLRESKAERPNRSIQDMFIGQRVNASIKQHHTQSSLGRQRFGPQRAELSTLHKQSGNGALTGGVSGRLSGSVVTQVDRRGIKNLHTDFEIASQLPSDSATGRTSTPAPHGQIQRQDIATAPRPDVHPQFDTPSEVERTFHPRETIPLHLPLNHLKHLSHLSYLQSEPFWTNSPELFVTEDAELFFNDFTPGTLSAVSSTVSSTEFRPSAHEMDEWRHVILTWLREKEGLKFVNALIEREKEGRIVDLERAVEVMYDGA